MLKFVSKKVTLQWFLLFGLIGVAIYTVLAKTHLTEQAGNAFLFNSFRNFFSKNELIGKGIIIVILLFQIVLLQFYFRKNEYSAKNNLLPACFYLSILLVTKSLIYISPFFFTLLFFLIIISTNYTGNAIAVKNNAFWVGMLIAFATCFDVSSIVLLALSIITLVINHFSKMKEIAILIFGFLLVYFYFFSYHFFVNHLDEWLLTFQQIKVLGVLDPKILTRTTTLIALITLSIFYFYFVVRTKIINDSKIVIQRKRIITLNTRAVLMVACLFISNSPYPDVLGYLFVHLSIYLTLLAQEKSPLYINEFVTVVTFVVLCL